MLSLCARVHILGKSLGKTEFLMAVRKSQEILLKL